MTLALILALAPLATAAAIFVFTLRLDPSERDPAARTLR